MASRRQRIVQAWDRDQAADLRDLPHTTRRVLPGPFGTFAERTRQGGPEAPTLDDGPLYTGEDREEVNGNELDIVPASERPVTILANLRRPWPFVGFAFNTENIPTTTTVRVGLMLITRSAHVLLQASVIGPATQPVLVQVGPAAPFRWIGMTGIFVGMRVAVWVTQSSGDARPQTFGMAANLWGYNAPGFGP